LYGRGLSGQSFNIGANATESRCWNFELLFEDTSDYVKKQEYNEELPILSIPFGGFLI
jgi:hypothetical protein